MKKAAQARVFSGTGLRHIHENKGNQDCVAAGRTALYTAAMLADGVSSVRCGGEGARVVCGELRRCMLRYPAFFMECDEKKLPDFILGQALQALRKEAGTESVREYASTLAGLLVEHRSGRLLYYSLGDSLGLCTKNDNCYVLVKPEDNADGCYVTVSVEAQIHMRIGKVEPEQYDTAIFFSDGAWRQIYSGTRLLPQVRDMLLHQDYDALEEFLAGSGAEDDFSFSAIIRKPADGKGETT